MSSLFFSKTDIAFANSDSGSVNVSRRQLPLGQGIGELQIDVIVEDISTPAGILLSGHQEVTLSTQHHRQSLGEQRRIQLNDIQWQFIG